MMAQRCVSWSAVVAIGLLAASVPSSEARAQGSGKTLLMHYMPWFQSPEVTGFWGPHWTAFDNSFDPELIINGRREIWSNYYPLIGPYDSSDPDVLEYHLLLMKLAGVDGVIADWYGLSSAVDYPLVHAGTLALFDATADFGLEFSVCYEDRTVGVLLDQGLLTPAGVEAHLTSEFQWMDGNWFGSPHYTRSGGRPLLLNFGPISVQDPTPWDNSLASLPLRPDLFSLHNLWTTNDADGGFAWVHWSAWAGDPPEPTVKQRLTGIFDGVSTNPTRVIPSAVAGFDDAYASGQGFPFLDHRGGETLRVALDLAIDGPWPVVQLVTWNDFTEGTMIEPTEEFGYTFLEVIQQRRRDELGPSFEFDASDLRLPHRLFVLRKFGAASDTQLDAVSDLLRTGQVDQARVELSAIAAGIVASSPTDIVVEAGGTITLETTINASGPMLVTRWQRDGVTLVDDGRITGTQSDTVVITNATPADAGLYRLVVQVGDDEVSSTPVVVGVRASALGSADFNGDGSVDQIDVLDVLAVTSGG
jgi:hypothetical protein